MLDKAKKFKTSEDNKSNILTPLLDQTIILLRRYWQLFVIATSTRTIVTSWLVNKISFWQSVPQ